MNGFFVCSTGGAKERAEETIYKKVWGLKRVGVEWLSLQRL